MDEQPEEFDEQEVRDLLAALSRTTTSPDGTPSDIQAVEPLPPDVARRLDDLLGELVAERSHETAVVPLSRTGRTGRTGRSERGRGWLAAAGIAAAVVLATVILPAVLDPDPTTAPTADSTSHGSTSDSTSDDTSHSSGMTEGLSNFDTGADASVDGEVEISGPLVDDGLAAYPQALSDLAADAAPQSGTSDVPDGAQLQPQLHRETLAQDVKDLLAGLPARDATTPGCVWDGAGNAYDVKLDGRRGLAVVTGRADGTRVVRLLACTPDDEPVEVATATVPAG